MAIKYPIYTDDDISVTLYAENDEVAKKSLFNIAVRWLSPKSHRDKEGKEVKTSNIMGGETDWFILPDSFGTAVAKRLMEQKMAGLDGFNEEGFSKMISWLIEMEEIHDSMSY